MDDVGRKHPAHGVRISLAEPTIVFLTVCTKDRGPWLACGEAHQALLDALKAAGTWCVGRYVLMPDHLHLFVRLSM
jgi:putative transposase